jgi:outer membrane receptor protein involved in Fe transport
MTWINGHHTMKFGYKGRQEYNNYGFWQQQQGSHSFGYDWTANYDPVNQTYAPFSGSGLASLMLGLPTSLSDQYNRGYYYFRQKEQGLYFQDSWKVAPRLTLNLGLRWDNWSPYSEKYNRLVNLNLTNLATVPMQVITPHGTTMEQMPGIPSSVLASWAARGLTWVTADSAGFPGALVPAENKDFGPRIGVAYRLTNKWVVRAGFGMYYWPMPLAQILASAGANPPLNLRFSNTISNLNGATPPRRATFIIQPGYPSTVLCPSPLQRAASCRGTSTTGPTTKRGSGPSCWSAS